MSHVVWPGGWFCLAGSSGSRRGFDRLPGLALLGSQENLKLILLNWGVRDVCARSGVVAVLVAVTEATTDAVIPVP